MSKKISALAAASNVIASDVVPVVSGSETKKVTVAQLRSGDLRNYGPIGVSQSADNALVTAALADIGPSGVLIIPEGCLYDVTAVSIPNSVLVHDHANNRIIIGKVALEPSTQAGGGSWMIRDTRANTATRTLIEPRGWVRGTATKTDWTFTPYQDDGVNYGIGNAYVVTDDATQVAGQDGCFVIGAKYVGDWFGVWQSINFAFSDNSAAGVALKMMYYDTSDTAWRAPQRGAWRAGRAIDAGDYVKANFKLYQAAGSGTTGATKPSHAAGSVSDGGITWAFVRDYQAPALAGLVHPAAIVGDRDDMPPFGFPNARGHILKDVTVKNGIAILYRTNSDPAGVVAWKTYTPSNTTDWRIESADGARFLRFGDTFAQAQGLSWLESQKTIANNSATPDCTGAECVTFANTVPTNITAPTGSPNQRCRYKGSNGNSTLKQGTHVKLNTGADKVLNVTSNIVGVFDAAGTTWIEDGTL